MQDASAFPSLGLKILLGLVLALAALCPLQAQRQRDVERSRLQHLADVGQRTTGAATYVNPLAGGKHHQSYHYAYAANGVTFSGSTPIRNGQPAAFPIIFDPAHPADHVVADSLAPDQIEALSYRTPTVGILGPMFAFLAVGVAARLYQQSNRAIAAPLAAS